MLDHTHQLGREDMVSSEAGFPIVRIQKLAAEILILLEELLKRRRTSLVKCCRDLLRGAEVIVMHALHGFKPRLMSPRAGRA